uniref:Putative secreted protein n=1 Tax=Xenopsylla cheopis TaxID=163159 RepID=A0A6M2DUB7_XENCH
MIIFKAHRTVISGIVIFPYANGCCLFTTSYDRSIQYWHIDPKTGSATAFPLKGTFGRSNCITTATSNIHWITPLISLDEVFGFGHANSSFVSLRDFTYRSAIILNALSQIWDLAACDWTNGFCQVTEGGEISAIYPQQLMAHIDNCKRIKKMRLVLGLCKIYKLECDDKLDKIDCEKSENSKTLIDKKSCNENEQNETVKINSSEQIDNSDEDNHINFSLNKTIEINERNDEMILNVPENDLNCLAVSNNKLSDTQDIASGSNLDEETIWESNYKDIKQKYGLIFYDLPTSLKDGTYDTNYFKKTPLTHYPLNALTRVDYNPNERSYGFVAIGMYAGFVRVRYIGEVQNPETN